MGCQFCDVPKVGPGHNATFDDLIGQVQIALSLHPEIRFADRINLHYARMGEPTFNEAVLDSATWLAGYFASKCWGFHPVISTMMPKKNSHLRHFLRGWMHIKNDLCYGNAGLQLSINSTDKDERARIFGGSACTIWEIAQLMREVESPEGRKITLNFAVADFQVDANRLADYFPPEHYLCKLTPMHKTSSAIQAGIRTDGDYTAYCPYQKLEEQLKAVGYDVLVFIASREEDEGRITCGNAILSGAKPFDLATV